MKKKLARPAKKVSKKPMPEMGGPGSPEKRRARAHAPRLNVSQGKPVGVAKLDADLLIGLEDSRAGRSSRWRDEDLVGKTWKEFFRGRAVRG